MDVLERIAAQQTGKTSAGVRPDLENQLSQQFTLNGTAASAKSNHIATIQITDELNGVSETQNGSVPATVKKKGRRATRIKKLPIPTPNAHAAAVREGWA